MMTAKSERKCAKCDTVYPATVEFFHRQTRGRGGFNSWCKKCNLEATRIYRRSEKGKAVSAAYQKSKKGKLTQKRYAATDNGKKKRKNNSLKSKYNLTLDGYNELFRSQKGCCAVCGEKETSANKCDLSVDHDHKTGIVRGLLCDRCNRMIGFAGEDISKLQKAIDYLGNFK